MKDLIKQIKQLAKKFGVEEKVIRERLEQEGKICEECGKLTDKTYAVGDRSLCLECVDEWEARAENAFDVARDEGYEKKH